MRQKNRRLILPVVIALVVIIGIATVFFTFQDISSRIVRNESYQYLEEVSIQSVDLVRQRIEGDRLIICSLADSFGRMMSTSSVSDLVGLLYAKIEFTHFESIVFVDSTGRVLTADDSLGADISGQDYFDRAIHGESLVSDVVVAVDTGLPVLVTTAPVYQDGEIIGIIAGRYQLRTLTNILATESFGGIGYSFLVRRNGDVLLSSLGPTSKFSHLATDLAGLAPKSNISTMVSEMSRDLNGVLSFQWSEQSYLLMYSPIGINDWYLVTILPQEVMQLRTLALLRQILIGFSLLVVLFVILLVYVVLRQTRTSKQLQQVSHDMSRFSKILPGGICRFLPDQDWTIVFANEGFYELVGYSAQEFESCFHNKLSFILYQPDIPAMAQVLRNLVETKKAATIEFRLICADGSLKWIWFNAELGMDEDGNVCIHSTFVNVNSFKQVQEQLDLTKRRYDLILEQTEDIIFDWNLEDRTIYHSNTYRKKLGYDPVAEGFPESVIQCNFIDERDIENFLNIFKRVEQGMKFVEGEVRLKNAIGESIWFRVIVTTVLGSSGNPVRAVGTLRDITAQKQALWEIAESAGRDSLTRLYNRNMTSRLVEDVLSRKTGLVAFAVVDIDNFKLINDSMGHLYGDVVLSEMARVLKENCNPGDIVGRVGGDEFCIFFPAVTDEDSLQRRAGEILGILHQFGRNSAAGYDLSASIGLTICSLDVEDVSFDYMFEKADIALYYAKRSGKNQYAFYSEQIGKEVQLGQVYQNVPMQLEDQGYQKNFRDNIADYFLKIFFEYSDVEKAIPVLFELIGKLFGSSRIFICEYSTDQKYFQNTFEWCNIGVASLRDRYQHVDTTDLGELKRYFDENDMFFCSDVRKLEGNSKFLEFVAGRDSISSLFCLITEGGKRRALMGFEQCDMAWSPSQSECDILCQLARIVCLFLLREREQQRVSSMLLDHVGSYAYVINTADYKLDFVNNRTLEKFPDSMQGEYCYKAIRGLDEQCPDCPLRCGKKQYDNVILTFTDGTLMDSSFSLFERQGREYCMVCCNEMARYNFQKSFPSCGDAPDKALLVDDLDEIVYVSDPVTYEVLYLNKAARVLLGLTDTDYVGLPCYETIQNRSKPCPYCTNSKLKYDTYYIWEHTNEILNRHYIVKDKLINWNGRPARMEFALDVTMKENVSIALRDKLEKSQVIIDCIGSLVTAENLDNAMSLVLQNLGHYYLANRTYIFEVDYSTKTVSNTYEWLAQGVGSQKDNLQKLPFSVVKRWFDCFQQHQSVVIDNIEDIKAIDKAEYVILSSQGIKSLYATPFFIQDSLVGFIGMDDPSSHHNDLSMLDSLSYFIIEELIKRRMQDELRDMGFYDSLTGLPNRSSYVNRLEVLMQNSPRTVGVLVADINGLKQINMDYGHAYGDRMVRTVGKLLSKRFKDYDVFRLDGDEFIVICESISQNKFIELIQKIREDVEPQSVSFGHTWSNVTPEIDVLISHADELLTIEKQEYYKHVKTVGKHHDPVRLERLKACLDKGEFLMYLQPKADIVTGRFCGMEALCRYYNEEDGLIPPSRFIPVLEKERLIKYIDLFIFEEACKVLDRWLKEGWPGVPISLNFSRVTLLEQNIVDEILAIHSKYDVPRSLIEIEITESIGEMEREVVAGIGAKIHEQGFPIALDDFGSKFTSMSILSIVPFNTLKLDRSLVDDIEENERTRTMIKHIIEMCDEMHVQCIAEGVETEGQWKILNDLHCGFVQGYYFDRPLPLAQFEAKYANQAAVAEQGRTKGEEKK